MNFNSSDFLIFFPIVTLLYFVLPQRVRWVWLLGASYYFYMGWNPRYAILIATSTVVTYLCGLLIDRENRRHNVHAKARKLFWIAFGFSLNLTLLFMFKYWGFFSNNVIAIGELLHITIEMPQFDILLPVGISFYTFQALGYIVDVYRGEIYAERNLFRYALFVSFFPQLVAGPIERSKNLLVQINKPHYFNPTNVRDGLLLMLWGFFMKVVISDRVAVLVDNVYTNWTGMTGSAIVLATLLFAVQIYCDFNGYSCIAIGAAQVMGFSLMENFRQPYLATSCADFWHRWHISLSSWLRDYLYIPLGGNRRGRARKYLNVMIVFFTSGLWHGAQWSYVVWGLLHGFYQVMGDVLKPLRRRGMALLHINPDWKLVGAMRVLFTFLLVDFTWLFFRAPSFMTAIDMIRHSLTHFDPGYLFTENAWGVLGFYNLGLNQAEFWCVVIAILVLILSDLIREHRPIRPMITALPVYLRWPVYYICLFAVLIFGVYGPGVDTASFIYFQF